MHGSVHGWCMGSWLVMMCWGFINAVLYYMDCCMKPPTHHDQPCTHTPPMHQPMHGPACPSTKSPIPPTPNLMVTGLHDAAAYNLSILSETQNNFKVIFEKGVYLLFSRPRPQVIGCTAKINTSLYFNPHRSLSQS